MPTKISNKFCILDKVVNDLDISQSELEDLYLLIDKCDGIIIQGGLFSDDYEIKYAKYAIDSDIPVFGICAGFNNIIRAMEGKVFTINDSKHNNEDSTIVHKNNIKENTLLYDILKTNKVCVNSIHTMFANEVDIKNLDVSAYLDDEIMNNIFKYFIEICKRK